MATLALFGGKIVSWALDPRNRWILIAIALVAWTTYSRMDAAKIARADCNATHLQARVEAQRARAEEAERLAEIAKQRADQTEAENKGLEIERDEILAQLTEASLSCDLSDDIRERLRKLQRAGSPGE